jgi:hypothetical protein
MKKMITYIIIGVVVLVIAGFGVWYFNQNRDPQSEISAGMKAVVDGLKDQSFASTIIILKDSIQVGSIEVKDNKLSININTGNDDLKKYLDNHKSEWEAKSFNLPIGGRTDSGIMWDGSVMVKIDDIKYLTALYYDELEFGLKSLDKYEFRLAPVVKVM